MIDLSTPPKDIAGYDPLRDAAGCWWDADAAVRPIEFIETMLCFFDGEKAEQPFMLEDWQKAYIGTLFGWKREDGKRRYTESLAAIPRKNGKTALGAVLALYMLCADGEPAAQVFSAAFSREQASEVFRMAAEMVRHSPRLAKRLHVIDSTKRIIFKEKGAYYSALAAEASNVHGKGPYFVLFDELHTQTNRMLYDALKTGQGKRYKGTRLFVSITTAGFDRNSICWEVWDFARKVRDGDVKVSSFLPCIYEIEEGDPWDDPETWKRCNPNLGVSNSLEFMQEHCERAKEIPSYENTFRNLYLNQWTEQEVRWLPMDKWRLGDTPLPRLDGQECWAGLDLSTTTDLTAFVMVFQNDEGGLHVIPHFWAPRENARKRERRDRVPYLEWARRGLLTLTDGDWIDYDQIRADINAFGEKYYIRKIAVDRWNASQIVQQLMGDGFDIRLWGQGYASMSAPSKILEQLVVKGALQHGGHEVLAWNARNVCKEDDAAENIKPSKSKSTDRIDGIVALVMAIGASFEGGEGMLTYYDKNPVEMG